MSNPHANHQGEPGDTGTGGPSREAVEMMAEHLHEEHQYDHMWVWPEHAEDDGYRGNGGYVTITPTDVQCRLREMAARVLIRADQIAARRPASAPTPPDRVEEEVGRDHVISARLIPWEPGSHGGVDLTFESGLRVALPLSASEDAPSPDPAGAGGDLNTEDDAEIDRIMSLSSDELRAELAAEGHDPDRVLENAQRGLDGILRLAADRKRWRDEAASWRRVAERLEEEKQALRQSREAL